jgi:biotin carboxylase
MAASEIARRHQISRVVALEEYDIVTAAHIREHLCVPGMGATTARYFQDKLAMRVKARDLGIPQPDFVPLVNHQSVNEFVNQVAPPWMLKPRVGASSMGMKKSTSAADVWAAAMELDARNEPHERSDFHLLEQFVAGAVYHVDSLIQGGKVQFANVSRYGTPPFDIVHGGGVTTSQTVPHGSSFRRRLLALNRKVLRGFGIERGVTHAEFIEPLDPNRGVMFLEVAARVGGAYTAETIEAGTGINMWREWARIELATNERPYILPEPRKDYSGIALSLARQEWPATRDYTDPEIVFRIPKRDHVGLIVRSSKHERVTQLLEDYAERFSRDFTAVMPAEERAEQHL